ncbi:MAG: BACON domain-containing protein [Paludibacter sp.]
MKISTRIYFSKSVILRLVLFTFIFTPTLALGQIVAWQFGTPASSGNEPTYNASTNNIHLNTSILSRGIGVRATSLARGFVAYDWSTSTATAAVSANDYFEFSIQANTGYRVSLSSLDTRLLSYYYSSVTHGPTDYLWKYSIDGGSSFKTFYQGTINPSSNTSGTNQYQINLRTISDLQNVLFTSSVKFRLYAWGTSSVIANGYFGFGTTPSNLTTSCLAVGGSVELLTMTPYASSLDVAKSSNSKITTEVTSNTIWTAESDQSWLNVNSGGTGNGTLTCTATSDNPFITTRVATVTLKATGITNKTVTITQDAGDATLSVSGTSTEVAKGNSSSASLIVTSNTTWTAESDQSWLNVNSGGTGNGTLTCTATSDNPFITTRIATVTLKTAGVTDKTVTVTQAVGDATLSVLGTTAAVTKVSGSTASLTVTSNSTWTATSDQSWLMVTSGATGDASITFTTTSENPFITTRIATITLKATGAADKMVTVTQAVGDATLSVSETTAAVTKASGSTVSLTVTSNSTWRATCNQSWLNVTSGATGNGIITFSATSENRLITTRVATVMLSTLGAANQTVTVTQDVGDATLSVSGTTAAVTKASGSTASLTVTSNSTWTATSDQSWLMVTSGATGDASITFTTTSENPFITTRIATITLKATGAADKMVTVTQAVGDATLSVSETTAAVTKASGSTASLTVTSNSTWTATSDQSWLTVTSGAIGDGTISFTTTSENPLITTRVAIVTLKASGVTDKTVTVAQAVGNTRLSVSANTATIDVTTNNTAFVNVTSNVLWSAVSNENWLSVNTGINGNGILTFTTSNTTDASRQAKVTVSGSGASDIIIYVTQNWGVNTNMYQLNMTVTCTVSVDEVEFKGNDLQIAAFIGDECRGIANLKYVDVYQRYMAFLMVLGNAPDVNQVVTFRCYNKTEIKQFIATNHSLIFIPEAIKGTPVNPYSINLVQKVTALNNNVESRIEIYPNPVKKLLHLNCDIDGIQQLDIFDTSGRKLNCSNFTNNTDYDVSNLNSGVYLLRINYKGQEYFKKFICE